MTTPGVKRVELAQHVQLVPQVATIIYDALGAIYSHPNDDLHDTSE